MPKHGLKLLLLTLLSISPALAETTDHDLSLSVGPGIAMGGAASGAPVVVGAIPGAGVSFYYKMKSLNGILLGGDVDVFVQNPASTLAVVIPILPAAAFEFQIVPSVRAILGMSFGTVVSFGTGVLRIHHGIFMKPGVRITLSPTSDLVAEVRVGGIGPAVIVMPHFGITL